MQPDLVKAGIVAYGFDRLPTYGKVESSQLEEARLIRTTSTHAAHGDVQSHTVQFHLSATAATAPVGCYCVLTAGCFDVSSSATNWSPRHEAPENKHQNARDAILEMRLSKRSLQDKQREEPSEFEREYPW